MYNCGLMPFFFNFASFLSLSPLMSYSELFQSALVNDERPLSAIEGASDSVAAGFTVDRRDRLRAGIIERIHAIKPSDL